MSGMAFEEDVAMVGGTDESYDNPESRYLPGGMESPKWRKERALENSYQERIQQCDQEGDLEKSKYKRNTQRQETDWIKMGL